METFENVCKTITNNVGIVNNLNVTCSSLSEYEILNLVINENSDVTSKIYIPFIPVV